MLEIEKLPPDVLDNLCERGWSSDQIRGLTPEKAFDECCMWEGLIGWGPKLRSWWDDIQKASK